MMDFYVDYCDVFINCWTHSVILTAPIHSRGIYCVSEEMLKFSKSVQMQKKTDLPFYIIVNVQQIFIFGRNIPLNI